MKKILLSLLWWVPLAAQSQIPLNDLSFFNSQSSNWSIVGDVNAPLNQKNTLTTQSGTGVLVCKHDSKEYGDKFDLFTKESYGDIDLSLDFMLGVGSNSGIYLMGRYEVQLFDSWGVKTPKYSDCGGIYQRRDVKTGNQYEGFAPRFNAYKAPGLWNNIQISFQAPRFDANGKKISNAKFIYVKLNGLLIHENVELSGPTGGPIEENEVASAPLRFQGDHGAVAIRNLNITNFNKKPGTISNLSYKTYYGSHMHDADLSKVKIDAQGKTDDITWEVTKNPNDYVFFINGTYTAPEDGEYTFVTQLGGHSYLKIDGQMVQPNVWMRGGTRSVTLNLKKGDHSFEIFNNKRDNWIRPALGFWSAGPGFRLTPHHASSSVIASKPDDPILVKAETPIILRSFMDFDQKKRIVHAVNVGSPDGIHYTYDLDKGAVIQAWKGDFLDATPMWHDRGDGSSRPLGSVTKFNYDLLLTNGNSWSDTVGTGYKPLGYQLDQNDLPTFRYKIAGTEVEDQVRLVEGKYLDRKIKLSKDAALLARLATGEKIVEIEKNLFSVDDKTYFIKVDKGLDAKIKDGKEIVVRPQNQLIQYSIIF